MIAKGANVAAVLARGADSEQDNFYHDDG